MQDRRRLMRPFLQIEFLRLLLLLWSFRFISFRGFADLDLLLGYRTQKGHVTISPGKGYLISIPSSSGVIIAFSPRGCFVLISDRRLAIQWSVRGSGEVLFRLTWLFLLGAGVCLFLSEAYNSKSILAKYLQGRYFLLRNLAETEKDPEGIMICHPQVGHWNIKPTWG